jgi:CRISPR system Cascade subunit CasE
MKLILTRFTIAPTRQAFSWLNNPYLVHQSLMKAYDGEKRLLFRIENDPKAIKPDGIFLLVQSHKKPDWKLAFGQNHYLARDPETKEFEAQLAPGRYRFRLLANPTVKKNEERLGLIEEASQQAWLQRKLEDAGTKLEECLIVDRGLQKSERTSQEDGWKATHKAIQFDGVLLVQDPLKLETTLEKGIGSAKGFGFGLLSLARF